VTRIVISRRLDICFYWGHQVGIGECVLGLPVVIVAQLYGFSFGRFGAFRAKAVPNPPRTARPEDFE
jgi:hypothetical protein